MKVLRGLSELLMAAGGITMIIFLSGVAGNGVPTKEAAIMLVALVAVCILLILAGIYMMAYADWKEAEDYRVHYCRARYGRTINAYRKGRRI